VACSGRGRKPSGHRWAGWPERGRPARVEMERSRSTEPGREHPRPRSPWRYLGPGCGHWGSGQAALRCVCLVCRVPGVGQKAKRPKTTDCVQDTASLFGWIAILFRFPLRWFVMASVQGASSADFRVRIGTPVGWEGTWPLSELHSCRRLLLSDGPCVGPWALGVACPGPCPYQHLPRISHPSSQGRSFNLWS